MKSLIKFISDLTLIQVVVFTWDLLICVIIFTFTQNQDTVDKYLRKRGYEKEETK
jgi:hypothetical protein